MNEHRPQRNSTQNRQWKSLYPRPAIHIQPIHIIIRHSISTEAEIHQSQAPRRHNAPRWEGSRQAAPSPCSRGEQILLFPPSSSSPPPPAPSCTQFCPSSFNHHRPCLFPLLHRHSPRTDSSPSAPPRLLVQGSRQPLPATISIRVPSLRISVSAYGAVVAPQLLHGQHRQPDEEAPRYSGRSLMPSPAVSASPGTLYPCCVVMSWCWEAKFVGLLPLLRLTGLVHPWRAFFIARFRPPYSRLSRIRGFHRV
jgi:hypothetical protein